MDETVPKPLDLAELWPETAQSAKSISLLLIIFIYKESLLNNLGYLYIYRVPVILFDRLVKIENVGNSLAVNKASLLFYTISEMHKMYYAACEQVVVLHHKLFAARQRFVWEAQCKYKLHLRVLKV